MHIACGIATIAIAFADRGTQDVYPREQQILALALHSSRAAMTNTKLPEITLAHLHNVTGGFARSTVGSTPGSTIQNDSKGLFKSLFGKRDPQALPSPLPNFRELLGF